MFSLQNVEKAWVVLCCRSKMLKKHWFYCVFAYKTQQSEEKTNIGLYSENCSNSAKPLCFLLCLAFFVKPISMLITNVGTTIDADTKSNKQTLNEQNKQWTDRPNKKHVKEMLPLGKNPKNASTRQTSE